MAQAPVCAIGNDCVATMSALPAASILANVGVRDGLLAVLWVAGSVVVARLSRW